MLTVRYPDGDRPLASRHYATWLSHRDLASLVTCALEAPALNFAVYYGVSDNTWRFWDISTARAEIERRARIATKIDVLAVRGLGILGMNDSLLRSRLHDSAGPEKVRDWSTGSAGSPISWV